MVKAIDIRHLDRDRTALGEIAAPLFSKIRSTLALGSPCGTELRVRFYLQHMSTQGSSPAELSIVLTQLLARHAPSHLAAFD